MPSETAAAPAVTQSGDLVRLDYDLWGELGGRTDLIDTTREEVAQQANMGKVEGRSWGPRPHQIGGEYFPAAIEASLVGLKVGDTAEREFAPAEAFGERDPKLIELYSMHEISRLPEMRREDAHLDVGTVLTIEGRRGRVVTLTAARVRVDFNPPFAGRKIKGTFTVTERITEPVEQARAIVEMQYGRASEFHIEAHEKSLTLKVPDRSKFDIGWMAAKPRVIDRLRTYLHPGTIRLVEEYVTPVPEKPAETKAEAPAGPAEPAAAPAPDAPSAASSAPAKAERPKGRSRAPPKEAAPSPPEAPPDRA
jgi:FKBP-type peptidyl-prolyl cis-trans isomerase 2